MLQDVRDTSGVFGRSAENYSKHFILIVIGNRHDLSPSLDMPEKHHFRFAFRNEFLGDFLKAQFKGNFILNLRKGWGRGRRRRRRGRKNSLRGERRETVGGGSEVRGRGRRRKQSGGAAAEE